MEGHYIAIPSHTVFVEGPNAEALSKRILLCLSRFEGMPDYVIQSMSKSVPELLNDLNATVYASTNHLKNLQVIMARIVQAAQSDDDWAAVRDGILSGMLKFDTKGMH